MSKSYGLKTLFERASFAVNEGEHIGVIGPNGAGKTTLFKILIGQESYDSGQIVKRNGLRFGHLPQTDDWQDSETVESYVNRGSFMPSWSLKSLGRALGLSNDLFESHVTSLSGGYRMRCKLLRVLGAEPDLLLLDEPTNYLDLESLLALENFLQAYSKSFLLISHDREFLRRTTDHIVEVELGDITKYNGSLDDYLEQKELLRGQLEARAQSLDEKRKVILDFAARFGAKASKAKQAQSKLKSLEKMESIELKALPSVAKIQLPAPTATGKQILSIESARLGYGEKTVLQNVNLNLVRGDHLAVVGYNGAGKSTLLKAMANILKPLSGSIEYGHNVTLGYFAQHVAESLDPQQSVMEAMSRLAHPTVKPQEVLNMAGSLLFSGDDVRKKISVLSGGEKSRVALGQILLKKSPFIILDEPTNHLDFQTVEGLTQSLNEYKGTIVFVSHDRGFVQRVATKILEIKDGAATPYHGTYDEYVWSCQKGVLALRGANTEANATGDNSANNSQSAEKWDSSDKKPNHKDTQKKLRLLERRLIQIESETKSNSQEVARLNSDLCDPSLSKERSQELLSELERTTTATAMLEDEWLDVTTQIESLK